ncbi:CsgG/HfaB family protein [Arcicella aquatica]|uniref:CsgG/HfaB family protein n=1 Tax=Arcicella aquatica TaxID=217141 RepID=A0ABU5QRZ0_9BACT|nr:CsgG/HfaB family protein [Arcicella aquatica]MEA5259853.1 CsgG/HfaB family protein [Arcicella aquatica]
MKFYAIPSSFPFVNRVLLLCVLVFNNTFGQAKTEILTNQGVVSMVKAGLGKLIRLIMIILFCILSLISFTATSQNMIKITKLRPAQLDLSAYQKIAIGDITGSTGAKTERAMDLADALTSELFNSKGFEIIDRNAINQILASQKGNNIQTINETTTSVLAKKINSAVLIVGRIQNDKIYKEEKTVRNIVVSDGCYNSYWWELQGDITVQLKIIDIKTGQMLFSNPVIKKINVETKKECNPYKLGDLEPILRDGVKDLTREITKIFIPYGETITLFFETPFVVLKNPFKKLTTAIQSFESNNNALGLEILKAYAEDNSLKESFHAKAVYNYGVGLFIDGQYDFATEKINEAQKLGSPNAIQMLKKIETEKQYSIRTNVRR